MPEPRIPKRRRRRIGLLWTLLAVFLVTALAPLFLTAWKLVDISRESLESASREHQRMVATAVVQNMDSVVTRVRHQLSGIGHYLESQLERTHMEDALRGDELLAPYLKGDLILMRYTSREGTVLQVGDREIARDDALSTALFEAFATSMVGDEYVGRPVAGGVPGRQGPAFVASVPVTAHGSVRGALTAVVDLGAAWGRGVNAFATNYMVLGLDDTGSLFASSGVPDALLEEAAYRRLEIVRRHRVDPGVLEIIPFESPEELGAKQLLGARATTDRGWGIFVILDRDLAYASVADMRRSVLQWALFAVGLSVLAAAVFAGAITRPVKVLVDRTRRIAAGDFTVRADIKARNEIGELADTFNFMAQEIRNHIERIKQAAEDNNQLFLGTIKALAAAIDEKDPYTRGHSDRVHRFAVSIGKRLGLSARELRNITVGALLHDVGKIGIEDAILRKPAALSDKEFEIMKRHPLKGAHIMGEMPAMKDVIPAMRHHHEKWSGGGYPDNLKGDEIPMIARIVQVADTFDAMTTNRPYQRAMRMDAAVARIQELSGVVFDPKVVAAFKEAWASGDIRAETEAAVPAASEAC